MQDCCSNQWAETWVVSQPCRWRERLRGHARGLHLKLSSRTDVPQLDFTPLLCLDGLRTLTLDQVGGSCTREGAILL